MRFDHSKFSRGLLNLKGFCLLTKYNFFFCAEGCVMKRAVVVNANQIVWLAKALCGEYYRGQMEVLSATIDANDLAQLINLHWHDWVPRAKSVLSESNAAI